MAIVCRNGLLDGRSITVAALTAESAAREEAKRPMRPSGYKGGLASDVCLRERLRRVVGHKLSRTGWAAPSAEASLELGTLRIDLGPICTVPVRLVNQVGASGSVGFRPHASKARHVPSEEPKAISLDIRSHALHELWNGTLGFERVFGRS